MDRIVVDGESKKVIAGTSTSYKKTSFSLALGLFDFPMTTLMSLLLMAYFTSKMLSWKASSKEKSMSPVVLLADLRLKNLFGTASR